MLEITPITIKEANAFIEEHHRHHRPVPGAKFALAVSDGCSVRGVAIVGRPVARGNDNGWTLEVNRVCTDGARNACSMLYGAAWRAAKAMGYKRLNPGVYFRLNPGNRLRPEPHLPREVTSSNAAVQFARRKRGFLFHFGEL